jgi:hypothetical protein
MQAFLVEAFPNRIELQCEDLTGPFISGGTGDFDPARDLEIYIDGIKRDVQGSTFSRALNAYLIHLFRPINFNSVVQLVHHMPAEPFAAVGVQLSSLLVNSSIINDPGNFIFTNSLLSSLDFNVFVNGAIQASTVRGFFILADVLIETYSLFENGAAIVLPGTLVLENGALVSNDYVFNLSDIEFLVNSNIIGDPGLNVASNTVQVSTDYGFSLNQ